MLISFTPEELTQHINSIIKSLDIKDRRKSDINTIDKLVKELEETIKNYRSLEHELLATKDQVLSLTKRNEVDRRALNLLAQEHQDTVYQLIETKEALKQANETTKYYRTKLTKISNLIK